MRFPMNCEYVFMASARNDDMNGGVVQYVSPLHLQLQLF